ncbi:MAG: rhodanese-like domain-containing protein [Chitinophagaceae bacterium]|nr:rhodanese-like domain-containing protein [Chitinophagaceae bacterium]
MSSIQAISVSQLKQKISEENITVIDTRSAAEFTDGFIPGSVFVGMEGNFTEWMLNLFSADTAIVLVISEGHEKECIDKLTGTGFTNIQGYLEGGFEAWKKAGEKIDMIINVDAAEMAMDIPFDENLVIVDVRKPVEFAEGHIENALNLPLTDITDPANLIKLEERDNLYVHCARGYRSVIAASLLKQQGYDNLRNVLGGWEFIKHTKGIKIVKETSALN